MCPYLTISPSPSREECPSDIVEYVVIALRLQLRGFVRVQGSALCRLVSKRIGWEVVVTVPLVADQASGVV